MRSLLATLFVLLATSACGSSDSSTPTTTDSGGGADTSSSGSDSGGTCGPPRSVVGACKGTRECREFTNPGLTEEAITSVCRSDETYATDCPKTGIVGWCHRYCGKNLEILQYWYEGNPDQLKVGCELNGEWRNP